MIVTIVTFTLPQQTTLAEITTTFQGTAPKYRGIPGLLRKNYFMSEDGKRAGGIYVWASRADAERVYTAEWKDVRHRQIRHAAVDRVPALAGDGGQQRRHDQRRGVAPALMLRSRRSVAKAASRSMAPRSELAAMLRGSLRSHLSMRFRVGSRSSP